MKNFFIIAALLLFCIYAMHSFFPRYEFHFEENGLTIFKLDKITGDVYIFTFGDERRAWFRLPSHKDKVLVF
jgi:hypothetical protein